VKIFRKIRVKNALGLHARPATVIVKMLQTTKSVVSFTYRKETVNARSIMSVLMLAATKNSLIAITVEGDDAQQTMDKLVELFDKQFGE